MFNEDYNNDRNPPPNNAGSYARTATTSVEARDKQVGGDHYKSMKIQPSEFIVANDLGWFEGNAVKYICRYKLKGGKQDIDKAIHYLELLKDSL